MLGDELMGPISNKIQDLVRYTYKHDIEEVISNRIENYIPLYKAYFDEVTKRLISVNGGDFLPRRDFINIRDLQVPDTFERYVARFRYNVKKAIELLEAGMKIDRFGKPIVVFYGIYSLAQAVYDITFSSERRYRHGLMFNKTIGGVRISSKDGMFGALADSIPDGRLTWVKLMKKELNFEEVLQFGKIVKPLFDGLFEIDNNGTENKIFNIVKPNEMISAYLFLFVISNHARYPSDFWLRFEGEKTYDQDSNINFRFNSAVSSFLSRWEDNISWIREAEFYDRLIAQLDDSNIIPDWNVFKVV